VYRPGQIVYYKAICYAQQMKQSNAVTNKTLNVEFLNSNREIVAKHNKVTDGFGAIYGEFTIPKNTLNGNYYIQTHNGEACISVSEYKRPIFEISINKPTSDYAAGDTISLSGNVKTFSGAALGDCNLKYVVSKGDRWGWNKKQILSGG
jgi:Large extracellular alpha-helical protein